jgi:hypothetical protein
VPAIRMKRVREAIERSEHDACEWVSGFLHQGALEDVRETKRSFSDSKH